MELLGQPRPQAERNSSPPIESSDRMKSKDVRECSDRVHCEENTYPGDTEREGPSGKPPPAVTATQSQHVYAYIDVAPEMPIESSRRHHPSTQQEQLPQEHRPRQRHRQGQPRLRQGQERESGGANRARSPAGPQPDVQGALPSRGRAGPRPAPPPTSPRDYDLAKTASLQRLMREQDEEDSSIASSVVYVVYPERNAGVEDFDELSASDADTVDDGTIEVSDEEVEAAQVDTFSVTGSSGIPINLPTLDQHGSTMRGDFRPPDRRVGAAVSTARPSSTRVIVVDAESGGGVDVNRCEDGLSGAGVHASQGGGAVKREGIGQASPAGEGVWVDRSAREPLIYLHESSSPMTRVEEEPRHQGISEVSPSPSPPMSPGDAVEASGNTDGATPRSSKQQVTELGVEASGVAHSQADPSPPVSRALGTGAGLDETWRRERWLRPFVHGQPTADRATVAHEHHPSTVRIADRDGRVAVDVIGGDVAYGTGSGAAGDRFISSRGVPRPPPPARTTDTAEVLPRPSSMQRPRQIEPREGSSGTRGGVTVDLSGLTFEVTSLCCLLLIFVR